MVMCDLLTVVIANSEWYKLCACFGIAELLADIPGWTVAVDVARSYSGDGSDADGSLIDIQRTVARPVGSSLAPTLEDVGVITGPVSAEAARIRRRVGCERGCGQHGHCRWLGHNGYRRDAPATAGRGISRRARAVGRVGRNGTRLYSARDHGRGSGLDGVSDSALPAG